MKVCTKCGVDKPLTAYGKNSHSKKDGLRPDCRDCCNTRMRKRSKDPVFRAKMKIYNARPERHARGNAARKSPEGKASYWRRARASPSFALSFALYRATKRRPSEDAVTHADLMQMFHQQAGRCAVSGIAMTWQQGKLSPTSMTMDRIDSSRGYSRGNVRLICHAVNMFKGTMSDDEMFAMAVALVLNLGPQRRELGRVTAIDFEKMPA